MNKGLIYLAVFALAMMVFQNIMTYLQYKAFQKNGKAMQKTGRIIGVGVRKGGFKPGGGAIVILAWSPATDRVVECRRLKGIAFWNTFKTVTDYDGMTLDDVRRQGIEEDRAVNKRLREKEPYSPKLADKHRKKGALIQAVEAIDMRLAKESSHSSAAGERKTMDEEGRARIEARKREIRNREKAE
ncbi:MULTISPECIES: transcriptional regulator GutM [Eubacterium]|uniref:DNA-binding transcriptional regulator of glucitol operon n=1 Tax=Eubacterium barkeri TaxID=1528 RepID=A0A1H3K0F8_EUBBA|nr:transcriptional regulator GutM [Eubacterium barkeri]SDY44994.1 DNA-binding transcriptional regulator of glucitol operon [Eubacterium barkeri]